MTADDFALVCRLVRDRSAVKLEAGKEYLVEARLTPVAGELRYPSVGALIAGLRDTGSDALAARVVEAMLTTETLFFRDPPAFDALRTAVLPDLIRRRAGARALTVWSAGCATGQEPYSLAMLLREHFPELAGWAVTVLATDLSAAALERARAGLYNQAEVARGLPAGLLLKYFARLGTTWQLRADVRAAVEFRELNLVRPWPRLPKMDLVLLRNVMIYFDVGTKRTVLGRVARVLRPDGYLLLGTAETTLDLDAPFARAEHLKGGFHQLAG